MARNDEGDKLPPGPELGEAMIMQIPDANCDLPMMQRKMKDAREAAAHAQRKLHRVLDQLGDKYSDVRGFVLVALERLEAPPFLEGKITEGSVEIEGEPAPAKMITIPEGSFAVSACTIRIGHNPIEGIAVASGNEDRRITTREHAPTWLVEHGCPLIVAQTLLYKALNDE